MDADSSNNTQMLFMKYHVHTQPLLLKIVKGDHKTDVITNYIRCPKFRTTMKAKAFGNLLGVFNSQEVTELSNHDFSMLVLVSPHADAAAGGCNGGLRIRCKRATRASSHLLPEQ